MLKEKTVKIDSGRDAGKTFLVTELPIIKADRLAMKIIHAVANAGFDLGKITASMGALSLTQITMDTIGRVEESKFLEISDELLSCVQLVPEGGEARALDVDIDVKDILTLMRLRKEAIAIHIDFLQPGERSTSKKA